MSGARTSLAAALVSVADHAGDKLPARHTELLYLGAARLDAVTVALRTIVEKCERDEEQGYKSSLRTYVLEIGKTALDPA